MVVGFSFEYFLHTVFSTFLGTFLYFSKVKTYLFKSPLLTISGKSLGAVQTKVVVGAEVVAQKSGQ